MSLLTDIGNQLSGETVYYSEIPSKAIDNVCCLYRVISRAPDLDLDGISLRNPSIRILVRDSTYFDAESRMEAIINIVTTFQNSNILSIFLESDIIDLGRDDEHQLYRIYCIFRLKVIV